MFSLGGWHSRNRRKSLPWASLLAEIFPARRSAAVGVLLALLLVPYASGWFLLAEREAPSCGMACCKGSKVCSCRRPARNIRQNGPGWTASSKCPEGCGQLPAVSGSAGPSLVAAWVGVGPVLPASPMRIAAAPPRESFEARFALFERPPPYI
jgi:hypothetical protein